MTFDRLLAKSRPIEPGTRVGDPNSIYLRGHLADAHSAAARILSCTGRQQLEALGLQAERWQERLGAIVSLSAAVHDLGKGNDHFQGMIWKVRRIDQPQGLRHEWVTMLILDQSGWREWLLPALPEAHDWPIVLWSIAGHHPAVNRLSPPDRVPDGAGPRMQLLFGHQDFQHCLGWLRDTFGLTEPSAMNDATLWLAGGQSVFPRLRRLCLEWAATWEKMSDDQRRVAAAAKACLIAADVAGSALPAAGQSLADDPSWIDRAFGNVPTSEELRAVVAERLEGQPLRPFQERVAESATRVTFARASCGTGKTVAAYHRAATRWLGRRLYLCYPTTGTATEGFRDYLFDEHAHASRFGARLFHGRAEVDLELVLGVGRDEEDADGATTARLESLDAWSTPIAVCTVDTVLGLIQNNRRGLYAWPALAGGAFVFDEIHAYDDRLFGALLRFLDSVCGVPVLLMTASLPCSRLAALRECLARRGETLTEIPGPADLEQLPRYHRQLAAGADDATTLVRDEVACCGKVLWVCNTVDRAMTAAERALAITTSLGTEPLIYHSRFRYVDRVDRHREVLEAFRRPDAALAVCTQVAEMSLDLSATLLVTDLAPVPAMIQRLGRLHRRARSPTAGQPPPPTQPFLVLEPHDAHGRLCAAPYTADELDLARHWLERLGDGPVSQADLAAAWEAFDPGSPVDWIDSTWLDGGPRTTVKELREASPGITVVLEEDLPALRTGRRRLTEVALPMPPPRGLDWHQWTRYKGVPVAPDGTVDYDPQRGARWQM